jgi:exosortase/archaeosortase family protein
MWRFLLIFVLGLTAFYALYRAPFFVAGVVAPWTHLQALVSSAVLNLLGFDTWTQQSLLLSDALQLDIKQGCDGLEPTAFFLLAVLAVPFPWRTKWVGWGLGLLALALLNFARIIGLYLAGIYWPDGFEFLHLHGGFALFFILTLLLWVTWVNWATRQEGQAPRS